MKYFKGKEDKLLYSFYYYNNYNSCKILYPISTPYYNRNNLNSEINNLKIEVENRIKQKKEIYLIIGDGSYFKIKNKNNFSEWISTDRNSLDLRSSYEFLSVLQLSSIKYIYMNHVLEHLQYYEIITAIINLNRVLKIGGELLISVPDLYDPVYFISHF